MQKGNNKFIILNTKNIIKRKMLDELKKLIEPNRYSILSKIILFNRTYAEYLLNFEKFKNRINYSENHLFWSNKNELLI